MASRRATPGGPEIAVGYVRVSTAREEMISPEIQIATIEEHARKNGYRIAKIIQDLDLTGRNFGRAGVLKAIKCVEDGDAKVIIVWKISRFGRTRKDWYVYEDRVAVAGGRLESATEAFDATTSTGKLTRGMLVELAAWESDRIGEGWKETHEFRIRAGLPATGGPRFGYTIDDDGAYHVDSETGPVLAKMYSRYLAGDSRHHIAEWLNNEGIPSGRGGLWQANSVRSVLESGFGAGLLATHTKGDRQWVRGAQAPVIDAATWRRYRDEKDRRYREPIRNRDPRHVLTGLIRCECESPMHITRTARGATQFRCSRWFRLRDVPAVTILAPRADRAVLDWLADVADGVDQAAERYAHAERHNITAGARIDRLKRRAVQIDDELDRLTALVVRGVIREPEYIRRRDELDAERQGIGGQLDEATASLAAVPVDRQQVAKGLLAEWDTLAVRYRRELLRQLVSRVVVERTDGRRPNRVVVEPV